MPKDSNLTQVPQLQHLCPGEKPNKWLARVDGCFVEAFAKFAIFYFVYLQGLGKTNRELDPHSEPQPISDHFWLHPRNASPSTTWVCGRSTAGFTISFTCYGCLYMASHGYRSWVVMSRVCQVNPNPPAEVRAGRGDAAKARSLRHTL